MEEGYGSSSDIEVEEHRVMKAPRRMAAAAAPPPPPSSDHAESASSSSASGTGNTSSRLRGGGSSRPIRNINYYKCSVCRQPFNNINQLDRHITFHRDLISSFSTTHKAQSQLRPDPRNNHPPPPPAARPPAARAPAPAAPARMEVAPPPVSLELTLALPGTPPTISLELTLATGGASRRRDAKGKGTAEGGGGHVQGLDLNLKLGSSSLPYNR